MDLASAAMFGILLWDFWPQTQRASESLKFELLYVKNQGTERL